MKEICNKIIFSTNICKTDHFLINYSIILKTALFMFIYGVQIFMWWELSNIFFITELYFFAVSRGDRGYLLHFFPVFFVVPLLHVLTWYWCITLLTSLPFKVTFFIWPLWWRFNKYFKLSIGMHKVTNRHCMGYAVTLLGANCFITL